MGRQFELVYTEVVPSRENVDFANSYNLLRKVPALVVDAEFTIYDSTVICESLDEIAGGGRLFPSVENDRWRILSRHTIAQGICEAAIFIRYEDWIRPEEHRWQVWVDDQWDKIFSALDWFEVNPAALETSRINIAHFALMSGIGYLDFRYPDIADWRQNRPLLSSWVEALSRRDCFKGTIPSNPTT